MPSGPQTRPRDLNELAHRIMLESTGEADTTPAPVEAPKNAAAVELGRLGGLKGGVARAAKLTPEKRQEIAARAAAKRWGQK